MSKNMEEEYRKMIAREAPDLWSRIESELPQRRKIYHFRSSYIRFAAGAAAAVIVLCIAFPAVRIGKDQIRSSRMAGDKAEQSGMGVEASEEAAPEAAAVKDTSPAGNQEQTAPTEINFGVSGAEEALENPGEIEPGEPEGGEESVEVAAEGETGTDDASGADKEYEDVPVSVTDVRTVNGEKVYTAKVLEDTETGLAKGDELLLKGDDIAKALKEGSEYSVSFAAETSVSSQAVSGNTAGIYSLCEVKENVKTED